MTSSSATNVFGASSTSTKRSSISVGTFTRANVCSPVERVAHERRERQRQARDVRKRPPLADGERRQHREDLAPEALVERLALRLGEVVEAEDADAVLGERREQRRRARSPRGAAAGRRTRSRIASIVSDGVRPSGPGSVRPASIWSCTPATRIWKNSSRFELQIAASLTRSSSGVVGVLDELQDAVVEVQPRQLAAEVQRLVVQVGVGAAAAAPARLDRADRTPAAPSPLGVRRRRGSTSATRSDYPRPPARSPRETPPLTRRVRRAARTRRPRAARRRRAAAARRARARPRRAAGSRPAAAARARACSPSAQRDLRRRARDERLQPARERLGVERDAHEALHRRRAAADGVGERRLRRARPRRTARELRRARARARPASAGRRAGRRAVTTADPTGSETDQLTPPRRRADHELGRAAADVDDAEQPARAPARASRSRRETPAAPRPARSRISSRAPQAASIAAASAVRSTAPRTAAVATTRSDAHAELSGDPHLARDDRGDLADLVRPDRAGAAPRRARAA